MVQVEKTREVIKALKKVRAENGYTLQRIQDMVLANGGNVSLPTIQKVFAEGSEEKNFRYQDTIKPIAEAMLDISPEAVKAEANSEIASLKAIILTKEAALESEQRKVQHLIKEGENKDKLLAERGDFMRELSEFMRQKDAQLKAERAKITILTILLIVSLLVIIVALIIDKTNPNIGFFWLDRVAAFVSGEHMSVTASGL